MGFVFAETPLMYILAIGCDSLMFVLCVFIGNVVYDNYKENKRKRKCLN